jgi:chromosome segregation protein
LDQELARIAAARQEAIRRGEQLAGDITREDEHVADADAALVRLAEERAMLERSEASDATAREAADAALKRAAAELAAAEIGLQQMTEACVTGEARRGALERRRAELTERRKRLQQRVDENSAQRLALAEAEIPQVAIDDAAKAVADAAAQVETARIAAATAAERLGAARTAEAEANDAARESASHLVRLRAEADALRSVLSSAASPDAPAAAAVLSLLEVPAGLEDATAALFDGELASPVIERPGDANSGWLALPPLADGPSLPDGIASLAAAIGAPPALARSLGLAGLVASETEGWALQPKLAAGQSLVDRDGRLWRWDGFTRTAASTGKSAEPLRQRNRLAAITVEIAAAESGAQSRQADAEAARTRATEAAAAERAAGAALRQAEDALMRSRAAEAELSRRALGTEARLAAIVEAGEKLAIELKETEAQAGDAERSLALTPDPLLARAGLDGARLQTAAARRHESEAQATIARLAQESQSRRRRIEAIAAENQSWQPRRQRALAQRHTLDERQAALTAEIAALAARPTEIANETKKLREQAAQALVAHRTNADALAIGEAELREANDAARVVERDLAATREQQVRCEVRRDAASEALARLRADIRDRLETMPEALGELSQADDGPGDPAQLAARFDRLSRERDAIGPVNLVAEREAEEVEARVESLQNERAELTEAIARLRRGIAALDQEGRKRLQAAFETLNGHFSALFQRLFGGGRAHLALTDADDPLDAGLEIMASPPGKRLQALSLLSGGEQALTAIALIFASFLTNPAPICVLDEVDAPLDDANVDRFCRLIADTADATGTKFLLITHHRVTMAHMDRLFGVTMPERGVSQLVSVDLARAAELRQTA